MKVKSARSFSTLALVFILTACASAGVTVEREPDQVQGLSVTQRSGFATLTWHPVPGATEYEIERTPVDASGRVSGEPVTTGIWRPNRQINQASPSFADAGFVPGERLQWRVRARMGEETRPYSQPVVGTTVRPTGPEAFLTGFELNDGERYTTYEEEIDWTRRIAAASPRVRVIPIGRTPLGRDINLFILGHPAPMGSAAAISASPAAGANCNIHGNEPSGREGCFMMIRELAFSNDPWVIDILSNAAILIVPSINADGRAANTRGNSAGQDLNRDHARITQPETQAFAAFLRDYTPEVMVDGHEYGNARTCELPLLWSRHSNTAPAVHNAGKEGLVEGRFYREGAVDGWWACPYPPLGIAGAQTFTRVTGLKNIIVTLVEARSQGGETRPAEGNNSAENRRRKAYSQLWSIRQALGYHRENLPAVQKAIADGIAFQRANTGPVVFHGDWDVQPFPAPHPGDSPPAPNPPGPEQMLNPPPCGYFLTDEQFNRKLDDSGTLPVELRTSVGERLAAHGIATERFRNGHIVRMTQPLRGMINIILDEQTPPAPIIAAQRLFDCSGA